MAGRRGPAVRAITAVLVAVVTALAAPPAVSAAARPGDRVQGGAQLASRGVVVNYVSRHTPRLPKVRAGAFVVADAGTGQVLAARDAHGWFRPASTLKVLTAIALIPALNPDATTVASRQAARTQPNDVGLVAGRRYKISSLFQALLMISANDAAVALAQATGSLSRGMALVNDEAHELRADDTVARNPNGLDAPGQHTSAYDEALIARQALASPQFLGYDRTLAARFEVKPRRWVTLVNQNLMLTRYSGDIGGKIGWTSAAGATYMGMARRHGVTLIVTLLHCPALTEFTSATRLLNWGFTANGKARAVGTLVSPLPPHAPGQPKVSATHKPHASAAPHSAAARRPVAAGGPSPAGPAGVGVAFLLLAALVVTAFAAHHRRSMASAARRRGHGGGAAPPRRLSAARPGVPRAKQPPHNPEEPPTTPNPPQPGQPPPPRTRHNPDSHHDLQHPPQPGAVTTTLSL